MWKHLQLPQAEQLNHLAQVVAGVDILALSSQFQQEYERNRQTQFVVVAHNTAHAEYIQTILSELLTPYLAQQENLGDSVAHGLETAQASIYLCPEWGTLAYDQLNPAALVVSERMRFFQALAQGKPGIFITSVANAMQRLAPTNYLVTNFKFSVGDKANYYQLVEQLYSAGYRQVENVLEPGEFSSIGQTIDFFPMGARRAYRINFFEEAITRIRAYVPGEASDSHTDIKGISLAPGYEFPTHKLGMEKFLVNFAAAFAHVSLSKNSVISLVRNDIVPQGIQYYLPFFFDQPLETIVDYCRHPVTVYDYSGNHDAAKMFLEEVHLRYQERKNSTSWPALAPETLYTSYAQLLRAWEASPQVHLVRVHEYDPANPYAGEPYRYNGEIILEARPEEETHAAPVPVNYTKSRLVCEQEDGSLRILQTGMDQLHNIDMQRARLERLAEHQGTKLPGQDLTDAQQLERDLARADGTSLDTGLVTAVANHTVSSPADIALVSATTQQVGTTTATTAPDYEARIVAPNLNQAPNSVNKPHAAQSANFGMDFEDSLQDLFEASLGELADLLDQRDQNSGTIPPSATTTGSQNQGSEFELSISEQTIPAGVGVEQTSQNTSITSNVVGSTVSDIERNLHKVSHSASAGRTVIRNTHAQQDLQQLLNPNKNPNFFLRYRGADVWLSQFLPLGNLQSSSLQNANFKSNDASEDDLAHLLTNKSRRELADMISLGRTTVGTQVLGDTTVSFLDKGSYLSFKGLVAQQTNNNHQLSNLITYLRKLCANFSHVRLIVTVANAGRAQSFTEMASELGLKFGHLSQDVAEHNLGYQLEHFFAAPKTSGDFTHLGGHTYFEARFAVSNLRSGFAYYNRKLGMAFVVLSEQDVIGSANLRQRSLARAKQRQAAQIVQNLHELHEYQLLIHQEHGTCQYLGLKTIDIRDDYQEDCLELQFYDTTLLLPVRDIHLLSPYSLTNQVDAEVPRNMLSAVSGRRASKWTRERQEALEAIRDLASELLEIQSKRELEEGYEFTLFAQDYREFCRHFRFEETPDQFATIQAVLEDMTSSKKMDRLICGDVGFGKTEVAMRAAFVAATNGKQVAVLVPTTLLAQQHYDSFRDRFAHTAVRVEMISSFVSVSKQAQIRQGIENGQVDIVVGTHAILAENVKFKDLGLLIVDEEHQFGVKQKEKIKQAKAGVDVISMTATPIPRTLNMALHGVRDISLINTPPSNRLPIITKLYSISGKTGVIRDAINREILRGGQVFFIHNDVSTIEHMVAEIQDLVPNARITYAHGQMQRGQLEERMMGFYSQRYNVLVCSTIVETGIDVPNANTIIINNAQNFGIAQLHQLRGRVGRSYRQAYAYLLVPNVERLTKDSVHRINSLVEIDSLGAGYILATHDLEIRGAGEILGDKQSGKVDTIGYSLYMTMLRNAVNQLQRRKELTINSVLTNRVKLDLNFSTIIPSYYIQLPSVRVYYYREISNAESWVQIDEIGRELVDRFGKLPPTVSMLLVIQKLRIRLEGLGIKRISAGGKSYFIEFENFEYVIRTALKKLISENRQDFSYSENTLVLKNLPANPRDAVKKLTSVLNQIMDFKRYDHEMSDTRTREKAAAQAVAQSQIYSENPQVAHEKGAEIENLAAQDRVDYTKEAVFVVSVEEALASAQAAQAQEEQAVSSPERKKRKPRKRSDGPETLPNGVAVDDAQILDGISAPVVVAKATHSEEAVAAEVQETSSEAALLARIAASAQQAPADSRLAHLEEHEYHWLRERINPVLGFGKFLLEPATQHAAAQQMHEIMFTSRDELLKASEVYLSILQDESLEQIFLDDFFARLQRREDLDQHRQFRIRRPSQTLVDGDFMETEESLEGDFESNSWSDVEAMLIAQEEAGYDVRAARGEALAARDRDSVAVHTRVAPQPTPSAEVPVRRKRGRPPKNPELRKLKGYE